MTYKRALPLLDEENRFFWTGGSEGRLLILRCVDCGFWLHPPSPICPCCLSQNLAADAVSGLGEVESFTVNRQVWMPGMPVPCVIALVALPEQEGLRLTTNLVGVAVEDVYIGQKVRVAFEQDGDVWLPLFEPVAPILEKNL